MNHVTDQSRDGTVELETTDDAVPFLSRKMTVVACRGWCTGKGDNSYCTHFYASNLTRTAVTGMKVWFNISVKNLGVLPKCDPLIVKISVTFVKLIL